jgi:hypothetical protein
LNTPRQLGTVRNYHDLHEVLRQHADELNVARLTIDAVSGLPSGYTGKLLGPGKIKRVGATSMEPLLATLGIKLIAVVDEEALERVQSRLSPRIYAAPTTRD